MAGILYAAKYMYECAKCAFVCSIVRDLVEWTRTRTRIGGLTVMYITFLIPYIYTEWL